MSYAQQIAIVADTDFRSRVKQAVIKAAHSIVGESPSASSAKDTKRHELGLSVLRGNDIVTNGFIYSVATQVGDEDNQVDILDASLDTTVASVWDDIAGVTYSEA